MTSLGGATALFVMAPRRGFGRPYGTGILSSLAQPSH